MARSTRRTREGGPASLPQLLSGVLSNLDLGGRLHEQTAVRAWSRVAGQLVSHHTKAEKLREGVLFVTTDSPSWAQELHMRQADLLTRLAALVGDGIVREIRFRPGHRRSDSQGEREAQGPAALPLAPRQAREIAQAAGRIADPALRRKAERAFTALVRVSAWRRHTGWRRCLRCGHWQRIGRRWCSSCLHRGEAS